MSAVLRELRAGQQHHFAQQMIFPDAHKGGTTCPRSRVQILPSPPLSTSALLRDGGRNGLNMSPRADLAWLVSSALPSCEIWANCCLSFWKNVGNNSLLRSLLQENDLIHNQQMFISLSLVPCGNAWHETA